MLKVRVAILWKQGKGIERAYDQESVDYYVDKLDYILIGWEDEYI